MIPQDTPLIVDASSVARDLLARFLARDFERVDAVASVAEAEARCEEEIPSLIVLDVEGKESLPWFLEWAKRSTRPSFVLVTSHPTRAEESEVSMHGAVGYLAKPISHRQLSCALAVVSSTFAETPRRVSACPVGLASLEDPITIQEQISCEVRDLGIEGAFLAATTPIVLERVFAFGSTWEPSRCGSLRGSCASRSPHGAPLPAGGSPSSTTRRASRGSSGSCGRASSPPIPGAEALPPTATWNRPAHYSEAGSRSGTGVAHWTAQPTESGYICPERPFPGGVMSVPFTILRCLLDEPSYGYKLQRVLTSLRAFYPLTNVNVYPVLNELEANGYTTSQLEIVEDRARKVYTITDSGRAALEAWLATPPETSLPEVRDHVHLRLVLATDDATDFGWLRLAIEDLDNEMTVAQERFERNLPSMAPVARFAVEEHVANLERRRAFLEKAHLLTAASDGSR